MACIHASSRPIRDGPDQRLRTGDAAGEFVQLGDDCIIIGVGHVDQTCLCSRDRIGDEVDNDLFDLRLRPIPIFVRNQGVVGAGNEFIHSVHTTHDRVAPEFIIGDFKQIRIFQNMFRQDSELTEDIRQRVMRAGQLDGQLVSVDAQAI